MSNQPQIPPTDPVILSEAKDPCIPPLPLPAFRLRTLFPLPSSLFPAPSRVLPTPDSVFPALRRLASTALVCILAVMMLGADASSDPSARFGRIGHNLMCVCGCAQVLLECNHVGCPDSSRMIGELQAQLAGPNGAGADSLITNWFVAKYGGTVLAAPIRGGFDNVAWFIPITLFVLATLGTAFLVKLWTGRKGGGSGGPGTPLVAAGAAGHLTIDEALRDRIRQDTAY